MIITKRWDDNKSDTDVLRLATADEIKRLSNINDHVVERAVVARWAQANGGVIVGYHDGKYDVLITAEDFEKKEGK